MIIKERGWPEHPIVGWRCIYHRNTLISDGDRHIIVSSAGNYRPTANSGLKTIGHQRWYDTRVFVGRREGPYIEADTCKEIYLPVNIEQGIYGESVRDLPEGVDNIADEIHDNIVSYVSKNFARLYPQEEGKEEK